MTKEEAAMEARAMNDEVMMAKMMMRPKNLLVKMFTVAEGMTVDMTVTRV
ncbi:MAG TPA: hypothetical protein VE616_23380 [Candidatus Udaeobacter sp.]|nr:hypothetical protein [Candidatus Udaeobacter sp.]